MMHKSVTAAPAQFQNGVYPAPKAVQDFAAFIERNQQDLALIAEQVRGREGIEIIDGLLDAAHGVRPDQVIVSAALTRLRDLFASAPHCCGYHEAMLKWAGARLDEFLSRLES